MLKTLFAPTAGDVAEVIREALGRGHTVILPAHQAGATPSSTEPSPATTYRLLLGLTRAEARLFVELLAHKYLDREALQAAATRAGSRAPKSKSVDVLVYRLRMKLRPLGIEIVNVHGQGFKFAEGAGDIIRGILAEARVELPVE